MYSTGKPDYMQFICCSLYNKMRINAFISPVPSKRKMK